MKELLELIVTIIIVRCFILYSIEHEYLFYCSDLVVDGYFEISSPHKYHICGALRDMVPFVQFKKREKHPWRSVKFINVAGFSLKLY